MVSFFSKFPLLTQPSSPASSESDPEATSSKEASLSNRLAFKKVRNGLKTVIQGLAVSNAIFNDLEQLQTLKRSLDFLSSLGSTEGIPDHCKLMIIELKMRLAASERKFKKAEEVNSKISSLMVARNKAIYKMAYSRHRYEVLKGTKNVQGAEISRLKAELSKLNANLKKIEKAQQMTVKNLTNSCNSETQCYATMERCTKELKQLNAMAKKAELEKTKAMLAMESCKELTELTRLACNLDEKLLD